MKYMVGYQLIASDQFIREIIEKKEHICDVYFSWGDMPNGRNASLQNRDFLPWEAQQRQMEDLEKLSQANIAFNLLLNGSCYGGRSLSKSLLNEVGNCLDYAGSRYSLKSVTTTSPFIARFIRTNFPQLEIRASVNMEIGTIQGMDYLADCFDSFYMKREYNRNREKIIELKEWCSTNQKKLYLLANSGCLNYCSARQFHDNLVAHEKEISEMDNAGVFQSVCRKYLSQRKNRIALIRDMNFVRPEDMPLYEEWFSGAKLATRVNQNPIQVLQAYTANHYCGNILELLEPNHSDLLYPYILENKKIPDSFCTNIMNCGKSCTDYTYFEQVLEKALVRLDHGGIIDADK